jgi:hypothetical protein
VKRCAESEAAIWMSSSAGSYRRRSGGDHARRCGATAARPTEWRDRMEQVKLQLVGRPHGGSGRWWAQGHAPGLATLFTALLFPGGGVILITNL